MRQLRLQVLQPHLGFLPLGDVVDEAREDAATADLGLTD